MNNVQYVINLHVKVIILKLQVNQFSSIKTIKKRTSLLNSKIRCKLFSLFKKIFIKIVFKKKYLKENIQKNVFRNK